MKSGENCAGGSKTKTFKNYTVLNMYIAQGQWQPPGDKILIATKKFNNLIIHY